MALHLGCVYTVTRIKHAVLMLVHEKVISQHSSLQEVHFKFYQMCELPGQGRIVWVPE